MNENINTANETIETKATQNDSLYTMEYCLTQIAKIQSETSHINDAFSQLSTVRSDGPGDIGAQERARALGDVVRCRETTNQKLLEFYAKMYEDLRVSNANVLTEAQNSLLHISDKIAEYCCEDDTYSALKEIAAMIMALAEQAIKN